MEAERLIESGRRALAESRGALEVMAEAWQAQALARTVGSRLALLGPMELRGRRGPSVRSAADARRRTIRRSSAGAPGRHSSPGSPMCGRP